MKIERHVITHFLGLLAGLRSTGVACGVEPNRTDLFNFLYPLFADDFLEFHHRFARGLGNRTEVLEDEIRHPCPMPVRTWGAVFQRCRGEKGMRERQRIVCWCGLIIISHMW